MPLWLNILILLLIVYLVISLLVYFLQDYVLFKPEKLPPDFQFDYEHQETEDGRWWRSKTMGPGSRPTA